MLHTQWPQVRFPAIQKNFQRKIFNVAELVDSNRIAYTIDSAKGLIVVVRTNPLLVSGQPALQNKQLQPKLGDNYYC